MYGARFSLAQQRRNQENFYRVMNKNEVNPAVFTSVESVVGAIPNYRSDKVPQSTYQPYIGAVDYPSLAQTRSGVEVVKDVVFHGVRQRPVMFSQ